MTEEPPAFGQVLRALRVAAGLTQQELAERARISARAISDLERGLHRAPHPDTAARIAQALPLPAADRAALTAYRGKPLKRLERVTGEGLPPRVLVPLTSFLGRERELPEVRALQNEARLLTLTGPGGIGKTRLAVELVRTRALATIFVDVAPVDSAQRLAEAVASTLGVTASRERDLPASIALAIGAKELLLVLDNCEHVLEPTATLVDSLLRACARLRVLATSREPLHVPGEVTWPVPPLELPDLPTNQSPEQVGRAAAVRLFVERARSAVPHFALTQQNAGVVSDVCRQLDGIPLAIELAAARVRALGIDELAARLDRGLRLLVGQSPLAPARQRTLRASLDWSYALLSEPERVLFARLGVFAGGWALEAAEAVCSGGELARDDVLEVLARLVDRSLVILTASQALGVRYRFLETVREYANERLAEQPDAQDVRRRHAAFVCALAVEGERELWRADQANWMVRLQAELGNVRVALEWGMAEGGDMELALRLAGALGWFWSRSGLVGDARAMLARLLARPGEPTLCRAWALNAAASLAYFAGDPAAGLPAAEEALAICAEHPDASLAAYAHVGKGVLTLLQGDPATAEAVLEHGLLQARACGDRPPLYNILWALGETARKRGDDARAERLLGEALALVQAHGDTSGTGYVLFSLGYLLLARGDGAGAAKLFLESLAVRRPAGDALGVSHCVDALAGVAAVLGAPARAARLFAAAESLREMTGGGPPPVGLAAREQEIAAVKASLGDDAFQTAWAEGCSLSLDEALARAIEIGRCNRCVLVADGAIGSDEVFGTTPEDETPGRRIS